MKPHASKAKADRDKGESGGKSDKTRPRSHSISPRRAAAARIAFGGGEPPKSVGVILRKAGFAASTSRIPKHSGLDLPRLAADALALGLHDGPTLGSLKPRAVAVIREVLDDKDTPHSTRAATAGAVLKLLSETGEPEDQPDHEAERAIADSILGWAMEMAFLAVERHGNVEDARASLDRVCSLVRRLHGRYGGVGPRPRPSRAPASRHSHRPWTEPERRPVVEIEGEVVSEGEP